MFKFAEDAMNEQRNQEVHQQQLGFNEDKHQLEMERLNLQLQQAQQAFDLKQQQQAEKQQQQQEQQQAAQQEQQQMAAQQQAQTQQSQVQQQDTQRQNIMAKAAAMYTDELEPFSLSSGIPSAVLGTGMGGAAAHYMFPTDETKAYRRIADAISPEELKRSLVASKQHGKKLPKELYKMVRDISPEGNKVRFKAPAHVRRAYFQNRALQSNAGRLLKGTGLGLLAGILAHQAMKD